MDVLTVIALNLALFAIVMVVLYYVIRQAVRSGIRLARRDRQQEGAAAERLARESEWERGAESRARMARAERERRLAEGSPDPR